MRIAAAAVLSIAVFAAPGSAMAYENFIPLGHAYSPEDSALPSFNSEQDRVSAQVDIYETEIYVRQRSAKEFSTRLDQFNYGQERTGNEVFIDY